MCGGGDVDIENTEAQKSLAEVAVNKWDDYQTTFVPMENKFIEDIQQLDSQEAMDTATNIAGVTNASSVSGAVSGAAKAMAASGINPNSTKFKQGMNNVTSDAGVNAGNNTNQVQVSQQDRYLQGLDSVNAMGAGKEASAISGMGDMAEMSHQNAISDYQTAQSDSQSTNQIIGAGVGAATRAGIG